MFCLGLAENLSPFYQIRQKMTDYDKFIVLKKLYRYNVRKL